MITSYILIKDFWNISEYDDICNVFLFFTIPIILVIWMVSLIIDNFMHNFLSFLFMFIFSTIFLYFVGCVIKRIAGRVLAEIFFSVIAINLAFLYLINNFTSIRLVSLSWIILLVSVLSFFSIGFIIHVLEPKPNTFIGIVALFSAVSFIIFIPLLIIFYTLEDLSARSFVFNGMNVSYLKYIKWSIIGIIYRKFITIMY